MRGSTNGKEGVETGIGLAVPGQPIRLLVAEGPGTPYGVRNGRDRRSSAEFANVSCAMIPMLD
jgi:hypothetical protein